MGRNRDKEFGVTGMDKVRLLCYALHIMCAEEIMLSSSQEHTENILLVWEQSTALEWGSGAQRVALVSLINAVSARLL